MSPVSSIRPRLVVLGSVLLLAAAVPAPVPASATTVAQLLPNLKVLPTRSLYLGGPTDVTPASPSALPIPPGKGAFRYGCDLHEITGDGARRCLRFDSVIANFGAGALELRYLINEIGTAQRVVQRIYRADGTHLDRTAGMYELDASHLHLHYEELVQAKLWRAVQRKVRGRWEWVTTGSRPVRQGLKAGFCLQDMENHRRNQRPAVEARYTYPDACYPTDVEGTSMTEVSGISPGWADVYDYTLTHQYIEVSDVRDGYYVLQIAVDPRHRLREATRTDNVRRQLILLCGERADLVGVTHRC